MVMHAPPANENFFNYMNRKADEWKKRKDSDATKHMKIVDTYKEYQRHIRNKHQGML